MKDWSWQKWVSRGSKLVLGIAALAFKFIAPEIDPDWVPNAWIVLSPIAMLVIDTILSLFPPKATG